MKVITYPTKNSIIHFTDGTIYLRSDSDTITQWCEENNYDYVTHEDEKVRFSNDGGLSYAFYASKTVLIPNPGGEGLVEDQQIMWQVEFGFKRIVASITVTDK